MRIKNIPGGQPVKITPTKQRIAHFRRLQGIFTGKINSADARYVIFRQFPTGLLYLAAGQYLSGFVGAFLDFFQDGVRAGFHTDVDPVESGFGKPPQIFVLDSGDGVRPGIGGDPFDLGKGLLEMCQDADVLWYFKCPATKQMRYPMNATVLPGRCHQHFLLCSRVAGDGMVNPF